MKKNLFGFISCLFMVYSCSEQEIGGEIEEFDSNSQFMGLARSRISRDVFEKEVIGYGWENVAVYMYDYKTKQFDEYDLWCRYEVEDPSVSPPTGMEGPRDYFFGKDTYTVYSYAYWPDLVCWDIPYTYVDERSLLISQYETHVQIDVVKMVFESVENDTLTIITKDGVDGYGAPLYSREVYKRMDEDTLKSFQERYKKKS